MDSFVLYLSTTSLKKLPKHAEIVNTAIVEMISWGVDSIYLQMNSFSCFGIKEIQLSYIEGYGYFFVSF